MSHINFDKQKLIIIQTLVNQSEVFIIIKQMKHNIKSSYNSLYFLLNQIITENEQLLFKYIEKIIIFINLKLNIQKVTFKL